MKKIKKQQQRNRKATCLHPLPTKKEIEDVFRNFMGLFALYCMADIVEGKSVSKQLNWLNSKAQEAIGITKQLVEKETKHLSGNVSFYLKNGEVYYE